MHLFILRRMYKSWCKSAKRLKKRATKPQQVISNLTYLPKVTAEPCLIKQPPNIVMLTRMVPKGVHVLIDALAILNNKGLPFHAVLAGQGEMLEQCKAQAQRLGLADKVEFQGGLEAKIKLHYCMLISWRCHQLLRFRGLVF